MKQKALLKAMKFLPKENTNNVFCKKYADNIIEVDFENKNINYGEIKAESQTTQNFSQEENWVVLECVNRLLEKGYKAKDIILEKVFPSGHGHSGRLDIFVEKDGKAFLMIECKTWGKEFEKELKNVNKNGGQLFTYFQNDKNTDFLVLYASKFDEKLNEIEYKNEIVVIEESYRESVYNIKDLFNRWNKFTKQNGIFEDWVNVYDFESKALLLENLKPIKEEDSHFIFNRFLEILRHNTVSDKPNAFNKIFTLFLCKVKDEDKNDDEELEFQWKEGEDDNVSFQKRLSDLYKKAMYEFLDKTISDFSDKDFESKYQHLTEKDRTDILKEITKLRLQKNNEFAIKDVFDEETFNENGKVLKEVVELLQTYKFRYEKKQPFLGDFFELLLTTGLKQETGQFFTPVPIARFICKSVPLKKVLTEKLDKGENNELLPNIIDYSAGSGHFLTESMEEIQNIIDKIDSSVFTKNTRQEIDICRVKPFSWAYKYIYGVELDYRLVKTTKVGCYLHGDGIANVIHGDGLDSFASQKYKNKLQNELAERNSDDDKSYQNNPKFDFLLSNPPYSVSSFKGNLQDKNAENDFELHKYLTDQSSEIEALFIERTKQLLKEGGTAGIILPSSILSNSGIYSKAREIIFKYFDIVAITELGSNTFMATGTNTVVLFLKRKNNYEFESIQKSVAQNFDDKKDVTINGIEKSFSKYLNHVWEEEKKQISFEDYQTLIDKNPNDKIKNHEIFQEYEKKIKAKNDQEKWQKIHDLEKEKITYFLNACNQKVVLVKTGEKKEEKKFLGYEFSNRRGSEGIHPIQRGKSIDECTQLFDPEQFYNEQKASTYILEAFEGEKEREIADSLKDNVSRVDLADMMTFDRVDFEKSVNLNVKKKIKIESRWELVKIENALSKITGNLNKIEKSQIKDSGNIPVVTQEKTEFISGYSDSLDSISDIPLVLFGDHSSTFKYIDFNFIRGADGTVLLKPNNKFVIKYFYYILKILASKLIHNVDKYERHFKYLKEIKIPLPPKDVQQKIVDEIESLEEREGEIKKNIIDFESEISDVVNKSEISEKQNLGNVLSLEYGKPLQESSRIKGEFPVMGSNGVVGWHNEFLIEGPSIIVGRKGSAGKINWIDENSFPIDTTFYVKILENSSLKFIYFVLEKLGLEKLGMGTGVPGLNRNDVYKLKFGFPSVSEQQKIVSQIEKIEAKIEKLEKELVEIPKQKEFILKKYL